MVRALPQAGAQPRVAAKGRAVLAGGTTAVECSTDAGASWRPCFQSPGGEELVSLAIVPGPEPVWLAVTSHSVHRSSDLGKAWSQSLSSPSGLTAIAGPASSKTSDLFVAGSDRLWRSGDAGGHWTEMILPASVNSILALAVTHDGEALYVLHREGLHSVALTTMAWRQEAAAATIPEELGGEASDSGAMGEDEDALPLLRDVAVDPHGQVLLATARGLRRATAGLDWAWVTNHGVTSADFRRVRASEHMPCVIGPRVVACFTDGERWEDLSAGFTGEAGWLEPSDGMLWLATTSGLYRRAVPREPRPPVAAGNDEPPIRAVQQAAIRYADAHPEKIRRWRRQAALRAALPTVSLGYDRDEQLYITSRGSTDDAATDRIITAEDPSRGFDLSLTWNLDELVWSDAQTSIDTRSKLMTELRREVVDEVTRLYYERRRLLDQLRHQPHADAQKRRELTLRAEELTALVDGLTDGYLSATSSPGADRGNDHGSE